MKLSDSPWYIRESITFLEKILNKDMMMLEYGSGASTTWFAKRVKDLISIEHDVYWFNIVDNDLKINNINNVDLRLLDCENYVNVIDTMGQFDVIEIDGRLRSQCIENSHRHVKKGGYLILDDAQRMRYQDAIDSYLKTWERFDFRGKKLTSIFQKQ